MKKTKATVIARAEELIAIIEAATSPLHVVTEADIAACREYRDLTDKLLGYCRRDGQALNRYDKFNSDAAALMRYETNFGRLLPLRNAWNDAQQGTEVQVVDAGVVFLTAFYDLWQRYDRMRQAWAKDRLTADLGMNLETAQAGLRGDVGRYYTTLVAEAASSSTSFFRLRDLMGNPVLADHGLTPEWPAEYDHWVFKYIEHPRPGDFAFVPWELDHALFVWWVCWALNTQDLYLARKVWAYAGSGMAEYRLTDALAALLGVLVLGSNMPPGQV
jgi:hypothetical protein